MEERILVGFSGGFDSTAALIKVLKETNYIVDVVRFECTKNDRKEITEKYGSPKIIEYIKANYRDFEYTTWPVYIGGVTMFVSRWQLALWCNKMFEEKGIKYKYIVIGRNKIDDIRRADQVEPLRRQFKKYLITELQNYTDIYYPIVDMNKVEVIQYIPSELYKYIATCRRPIIIQESMPEKDTDWYTWYSVCVACTSCTDMRIAVSQSTELQKYPGLTRYNSALQPLPESEEKENIDSE